MSQVQIATGIFDLQVESSLATAAVPGQFAGLYVPNDAKMLPRPISICDADSEKGILRFVYRVTGKNSGTAEIARLKPGDQTDILGLLGNGYDLSEADGKNAVLLGGGVGVPPMIHLAKKLTERQQETAGCLSVTSVMGYRNSETFLAEEFKRYGVLRIATDDGSAGTQGTVLDVLKSGEPSDNTVYFACGPAPMLKALKKYVFSTSSAENRAVPKLYISLEERMACGIGVCLGCVTKTVHKDAHSGVHNARICTEGPVFDAAEVNL